MMCSSEARSPLYVKVVPKNQTEDSQASASSSLILPTLLSNLFVSLMGVLKMVSECSPSLARSHSLMLLVSAAYAEFLPDMFL